MTDCINKLLQHELLKREEAKQLMIGMTSGEFSDVQLASILTAYNMRAINQFELAGFRDALLELCSPLPLEGKIRLDLCGTGGDGKDTFNVSTLTAFVLSVLGIPVTKHGNYGVSSVCGSSDVLEALGVHFQTQPDVLQEQLTAANLCFIHAPLFHPAMKKVSNVRRELKVRTIFNLLGPLVNPSFPTHQFTGVSHLAIMRLYEAVLDQTNVNYSIVHSYDGYDEISLTGDFKNISRTQKRVLGPKDFESRSLLASEIQGGKTKRENAKIFSSILNGKGSEAQKKVVSANVALAYESVDGTVELPEIFEDAMKVLSGNSGAQKLTQIINLQA